MQTRPLLPLLFGALSLVFSVMALSVYAQAPAQTQSLYTPRNIRNAFIKGTRSPDGNPGPRYWQNTGRYTISLRAAPPDRTIRGSEQIVYVNNSPDTLKTLVFKFILNIHRPGALRYDAADPSDLNPGIVVDAYSENGRPRHWSDPGGGATSPETSLDAPLLPHDSVRLGFDWHYEISPHSGREGMIDSTTYYLAYAYPRVAVYDDYNGWDRWDFTNYQEFYNDFNDYTLSVSVPRNYLVWSTGTLENPDEVLQPEYAARLKTSLTGDPIIHIATAGDLATRRVTAQNAINTWQWKADAISDMTVAISDHYVWDGASVVADTLTGRRAAVQAAYNDTAKDFHRMVEFGVHSLYWLSRYWPGIAYPFPKTTIVQGYADMEYPMMVNDATNDDPEFSRFVAEHEIAHSWFPFYMGINEARYPFMDEGWATTFEFLIGREDLGAAKAEEFYKEFRVRRWINDPSTEEDLPIITPANLLRGVAYGNNAYGKPSLGYLAVKDMLGDALFKKSLHAFMNRWHGKHPIPWDFFYSINEASGKNLNWFWSNWFFSNNYIDLAIEKATRTPGGYTVSVQNIGGMAAPFDLEVQYADGSMESFHQSPWVWSKGSKKVSIPVKTAGGKRVRSIELKNGIFMDANPADNQWQVK
ncbi:MAG: M1 family metallopeptidase [Puia sp.]|nr:M1 family metallopeptidase [Puia sp.]